MGEARMCEKEGAAASRARKRGGADAREEEGTDGVGCGGGAGECATRVGEWDDRSTGRDATRGKTGKL
jgi:hypothetical protein